MKLLVHILALLFPFILSAQPGRERVEALRVAFIEKKLQLSNAESEKFWPVYNEYNDKVRELRRHVRMAFHKAGENVSAGEAEELYRLESRNRQAELEVHAQYSERLKAMLGSARYIRLRLAEDQFKREMLKAID
jgi:hypothetical protein